MQSVPACLLFQWSERVSLEMWQLQLHVICIYAFIYTFCHLFSFIIGHKTNFYVGIALTLTPYLICPFISVFLMLLIQCSSVQGSPVCFGAHLVCGVCEEKSWRLHHVSALHLLYPHVDFEPGLMPGDINTTPNAQSN